MFSLLVNIIITLSASSVSDVAFSSVMERHIRLLNDHISTGNIMLSHRLVVSTSVSSEPFFFSFCLLVEYTESWSKPV